jgi:hypothetical protein
MPYTYDFKKLKARVERDYLGKPVPTIYVKRYGKKYNKKDILPLSYAIAKSRGIQIDKLYTGNKEVKKI